MMPADEPRYYLAVATRRLVRDPSAVRRERLGEAVRQARQSAGPEAALRILEVDPGSRLPERRTLLAPFHDEKRKPRR